jgi:hypothetical protein
MYVCRPFGHFRILMQIYIHTNIYAYMHTYIHTYTYIHRLDASGRGSISANEFVGTLNWLENGVVLRTDEFSKRMGESRE